MREREKGQRIMHIVLVAPEIPQNTGNIARTCAATGAMLHLVKPLGFSLSDRYLKRAGLDYWHMMDYRVHDDFKSFLTACAPTRMHFATARAARNYAEVSYGPDDYLIFGCESKGLPQELVEREYESCIRIPMRQGARSLNLSNSVAVVLFEALRQQGFPDLLAQGKRKSGQSEPAAWMDYL
jgi:tRNA (cytidine/uridine-2'-O-)-methyltransferase